MAFSSKEQDAIDALRSDLDDAVKDGIKQVGLEAMELMTSHVSGDSVSWSGGTFRVNVNTGNLRRHVRMEYPYLGSEYAVGVFNNAAYAQDVEEGVKGDERKRRLLSGGKPPKRSKKTGRACKVIPHKEGSLVRFWAVTEDSVLPDQEPRPFAEATEEQMNERAPALLGDVLARKVEG